MKPKLENIIKGPRTSDLHGRAKAFARTIGGSKNNRWACSTNLRDFCNWALSAGVVYPALEDVAGYRADLAKRLTFGLDGEKKLAVSTIAARLYYARRFIKSLPWVVKP